MTRPDVITDRDLIVLGELRAANKNHLEVGFRKGWARPMDCGGFNGSHHSKTLQKLARLGFVEMSRETTAAANGRPGILYRITEAGIARDELERDKLRAARQEKRRAIR